MSIPCELVVDAMSEVGESAIWDHRRGSLWWVDMFKGQLYEWHPNRGMQLAAQVDQTLGFVVPTDDGEWIAGIRDGFARIDKKGNFNLIAEVQRDQPDFRMNDGKTDLWGRVWAGTVSDADPVDGGLYRLETDGTVTQHRDNLQLPNGIAWTADGSRMFITDSNAYSIEVWSMTEEPEPQLDRLTSEFTLTPEQGKPDGIAVDQEGGLWVALFGGGAVVRFSPDGDIDRRIDLPVPNVTTLAFGGDDFSDLYITTARYAMSGAALGAHPRESGAVFKCDPGVRGFPVALCS